jgi:hypothetical protein
VPDPLIATFNVENLVTRPAAMAEDSSQADHDAIDDHAELNGIIRHDVFSAADTAAIVWCPAVHRRVARARYWLRIAERTRRAWRDGAAMSPGGQLRRGCATWASGHIAMAPCAASTWPGMTRCHVEAARQDHARSKRSRFITLAQAATKSCTNFACASELP